MNLECKAMEVSVFPRSDTPLMIALMSPGVLKAMIFIGGMYLFYLADRRVAAKNNGWGILHTWVDKIVSDGKKPKLSSKQNLKNETMGQRNIMSVLGILWFGRRILSMSYNSGKC